MVGMLWQQKKAGVLPPFWSLSPFVVAVYKSLACLGKCALEREFMTCMAGLCVPGQSLFHAFWSISEDLGAGYVRPR